jgi:acylphosphatase
MAKPRSSENSKRIGATVVGRVQGVGFRYFVRFEAARFGLTGWVCNLPDGNVELEAQGGATAVDAFLGEIAKGPPLAYVDEVKSFDMPLDGDEERFEIRH